MSKRFGVPGKSGGDWIRGKCQRASFVTDACSLDDPQCPTCQVAAEYDRMEALIGSGKVSAGEASPDTAQERSAKAFTSNHLSSPHDQTEEQR